MIQKIEELAKEVKKLNGETYFVGGYVRDKIINKIYNKNIEIKDIDVEIHGITIEKLKILLNKLGGYVEIGKSFGIFKLNGYDFDIALPRVETKKGLGHRDFDITVNPFLGTYNSSIRRDFTINSIMQNVLTGEYIDHFNGIDDIKNKIIRHIDEKTFVEDSLRVLRACQLSSRLDFEIYDYTRELCKNINIKNLSRERVYEELKKSLLMSNHPSKFFYELDKMNKLDYWFREIFMLKNIRENPKYHGEENTYIHTMLVIDEASKLRDNAEYPLYFMLSALCHDFGKIVSTKLINNNIHSINHEIEGIPIVKDFLTRITNEKKLIKYVINMTKLHMKPNRYAKDNSKIKYTNKMYYDSISPNDLILLSIADSKGKIQKIPYKDNSKFLLSRYEIYEEYMKRPYINGSDLINAGIKTDDNFKKWIDMATNFRLSGVKKENALKQILYYYNN